MTIEISFLSTCLSISRIIQTFFSIILVKHQKCISWKFNDAKRKFAIYKLQTHFKYKPSDNNNKKWISPKFARLTYYIHGAPYWFSLIIKNARVSLSSTLPHDILSIERNRVQYNKSVPSFTSIRYPFFLMHTRKKNEVFDLA